MEVPTNPSRKRFCNRINPANTKQEDGLNNNQKDGDMGSGRVIEGIRVEEAQPILNTLVQASGEGFIVIDAQNIIILASPLLESIWGYEPGELVGKPVQTLMPHRYRADHTAGVRRFVMENRKETSGEWAEVEALHKDGTEFTIHIRFMRVQHEGRFLLAAAVRSASPYQRARLALEAALKLVQHETDVWQAQLHQALEAVEQLNLAHS
jgi:PAS domain S-box-containing protein